jgi:hypothetical protein
VEKRLQLLYPHEYSLDIESTEYFFSVQMEAPLKNAQVTGHFENTRKPATRSQIAG